MLALQFEMQHILWKFFHKCRWGFQEVHRLNIRIIHPKISTFTISLERTMIISLDLLFIVVKILFCNAKQLCSSLN